MYDPLLWVATQQVAEDGIAALERAAQVHGSALPLVSYVAFGEFLNLSVCFLICELNQY